MTETSRILVRRAGAAWTTPETAAYENEAHLQALLAADPARVPGVAEGAYAVRELPTAAGPIDVCIVDSEGRLTVVECKLASNSESKRQVIGQVIDYASAIGQDGERSFFAGWGRRGGLDLAEALTPSALEQLKRNIVEARINLCLAVDLIDADLRRLVEYLNLVTQAWVSVTALQLAYARDGDIEILIPSTYGGELAAAKARGSGAGSVPWTRESFVDALAAESDRELALRLLSLSDTIERRGTHEPLWFGISPNGGIYFCLYGLRFAPFQIWVNKAGQLMATCTWKNYPTLTGHPGFAELAAMLNQDHYGGAKAVPVASLDVDEFWAAALRAGVVINE